MRGEQEKSLVRPHPTPPDGRGALPGYNGGSSSFRRRHGLPARPALERGAQRGQRRAMSPSPQRARCSASTAACCAGSSSFRARHRGPAHSPPRTAPREIASGSPFASACASGLRRRSRFRRRFRSTDAAAGVVRCRPTTASPATEREHHRRQRPGPHRAVHERQPQPAARAVVREQDSRAQAQPWNRRRGRSRRARPATRCPARWRFARRPRARPTTRCAGRDAQRARVRRHDREPPPAAPAGVRRRSCRSPVPDRRTPARRQAPASAVRASARRWRHRHRLRW